MTNFAQLKEELDTEAAQQRADTSRHHQKELLQLEQLRATLDETLEQSVKAGQEDLVQLEQTVGALQMNGAGDRLDLQDDDEKVLVDDVQNVQLDQRDGDDDDLEESDFLQVQSELLLAQKSNNSIQNRLKVLLASQPNA